MCVSIIAVATGASDGCIRDQPGHRDHTWTDAVRVRSVGTEEGFAYGYASTDDDRKQFPEDEIIIGVYRRDLNCDPDGEAKMTVAQAEQLIVALQGSIAFTQEHAQEDLDDHRPGRRRRHITHERVGTRSDRYPAD